MLTIYSMHLNLSCYEMTGLDRVHSLDIIFAVVVGLAWLGLAWSCFIITRSLD